MVTDEGKSYSGKYFKMTKNIVLNDYVITNDLKRGKNGEISYEDNKEHFDKLKIWSPIGQSRHWIDDSFKGIFDGGGHYISGIYSRDVIVNGIQTNGWDTMRNMDRGLFGLCVDAQISNLTIKDSYIALPESEEHTAAVRMGILLGEGRSCTITNCHVENSVVCLDKKARLYSEHNRYEGDICIGGVIGSANTVSGTIISGSDNIIKDCSFNGIVQVTSDIDSELDMDEQIFTGGIVGSLLDAHIYNCHAKGTLLVEPFSSGYPFANYIGGISGGNDADRIPNSSYDVQFVDCSSGMNIIAYISQQYGNLKSLKIGGIVGCTNASCQRCLNYGNISYGYKETSPKNENALKCHVAGIAAYAYGIENCANYGVISLTQINPQEQAVACGLCSYVHGYYIPVSNNISKCNLNYEGFGSNLIKYDPLIVKGKDDSNTEHLEKCYYSMKVNGSEQSVKSQFLYEENMIDEAQFKSGELAAKLNQGVIPVEWGIIEDASSPINGYVAQTLFGATTLLPGAGTEADPILIGNESDLRNMVSMLNNSTEISQFQDKYFKLTANIDMTRSEALPTIMPKGNSFKGILDGNGHYIRGIKSEKGSLIYSLLGTVKNLTLLDFQNASSYEYAGAIAERVGDFDTNGTIQNCFVTGNLEYNGTKNAILGGIASDLYPKGKIENSYFIGSLKLVNAQSAGLSSYMAGIVPFCYDKDGYRGEVKNCYAVVSYEKTNASFNNDKVGAVIAFGDPTLTNNMGVVNYANGMKPSQEYTAAGVTIKNDETEIHASDLGDAWMEGRHHPVLKNAYHYECTDYKGNIVGLDPVYREITDNNDFLALTPKDDQKTDTKMWQLAKLVVYSATNNAYYATDLNINLDKEIHFKPGAGKEDVKILGSASYKMTAHKGDNWYSLCLPGAVDRNVVAEDVKFYVGGKLTDGNRLNIVEVESVPAGVPFLMYYNNELADEETFYITTTGELKLIPQRADENSDLTGTFQKKEGGNYYTTVVDQDGTLYLQKKADVSPFSAYVESDGTADKVELSKYLLLDEESNDTEALLEANNGKKVSVKLRRNLKTGGWNTICLPFDISASDTYKKIDSGYWEELTAVSYDATAQALVMKFEQITNRNGITAGKPYLVSPYKNGTIYDLGERTLSKEITPTTFENINMGNNSLVNVSMIGSYSKFDLMSTEDEDQYFLQQDKFYRATAEQPVISNGYRCWFKVTSSNGVKAENLQSARIIHADGSTTNIKLVNVGKTKDGSTIYDLQGISHKQMQKGINIVGGKKILKK